MRDAIAGKFTNALAYRRYKDNLHSSVYEQLLWGIDKLGVSSLWQDTLSPLRLTYKPTGQQILFRGADSATKSKSIKVSRGYIKYLTFSEEFEISTGQTIQADMEYYAEGSTSNTVNIYVNGSTTPVLSISHDYSGGTTSGTYSFAETTQISTINLWMTLARQAWNIVGEEFRITPTLEKTMAAKQAEFGVQIKKLISAITDDEIEQLRQAVAGEVNKGKAAVEAAAASADGDGPAGAVSESGAVASDTTGAV